MNTLSLSVNSIKSLPQNENKSNVLMTTKEVAEQLHTSNKVILENAKKCLPNKRIENGKTTFWNEEEVTVLIEQLKTSNPNQYTFTGAVKAVSTNLTPALKIKKAMELMQEGYEEELAILKAKNAELQPKAEFAEAISDSEDLLIMGDVCKVLGLKYGCITLYKHLVTLGVLNQQHIPYQEFVNRGYFKLCENKITDSYGKTHVTITTKVYQKGVKYIMELLKKNNLFNSTMAS